MHVLTLVFVLLASCALIAALQDSLCIQRRFGLRSAIHQERCTSFLDIPILLSSLLVTALLVWAAWDKQIAF